MTALKDYGSLVNLISDRSKQPEPEIGMGATYLGYTDRRPYTIIAIHSPTRIVVQADRFKRTDDNGMSECQDYTYSPDPDGACVTLRKRKNGGWAVAGSPGTHYAIGYRQRYYDYSF